MTPDLLDYLKHEGHTQSEAAGALGLHCTQFRRLLLHHGIRWRFERDTRPPPQYANGVWRLGIRLHEWRAIMRAVDRHERTSGSRDDAINCVATKHKIPAGAIRAFEAGEHERID